ncbi:MAG: NAD(P)H-hydrate dehydratase, partial [Chloroflexota bacterium]|nr:NAD(P)H-hydrate dehydratase [Chloroflexota bacterium]
LETNDISHNRIDVLQQTASKLNAIIVLKGAHSLIGYPDKSIAINLSGNPGMSTAGSGDTLTGTIAAMFCLGLPLNDAIRTGVFLHGFAGDLAAAAIGQDGMTARDILERLPQAMKHLREERTHVGQNYYQRIFTI